MHTELPNGGINGRHQRKASMERHQTEGTKRKASKGKQEGIKRKASKGKHQSESIQRKASPNPSEGCPNPPESCPKPLGFWFRTYGALPIGHIGPYKGPIRAPYRALFWALFSLCGLPIFPLWVLTGPECREGPVTEFQDGVVGSGRPSEEV